MILLYVDLVLMNAVLAGHGKPVDVWTMGVVTYFLLAGTHPFVILSCLRAEKLV